MTTDSYITISSPGEAIFKERGSKFLAFAFHVESEEEADAIRKDFKKKYYDATHVVYAFRLGPEGDKFRAADDGEPSGSSGLPVLNTIKSRNVTNVIVLVVRYFGGTKLGIPGLIDAYSQSAAMALDASATEERLVTETIDVVVPYSQMNFVMRIIKENDLQIAEMGGSVDCEIKILVRKNLKDNIVELLNKNGQ
ncbi:MAG: YigZ family protein, partial [Bacteroidales bacterium]|nr:YigZ family protein [Bacteroidales bacterium]